MSVLREFRRPRLWLGAWIVALLAALAICLVPLHGPPLRVDHGDKIAHLAGFWLLAGYAAMLFATPGARAGALLVLFAWGLLIEALQATLPWRSADPLDVLANSVGLALGALFGRTRAATWLQQVDRRWG